VLLDLRMGEGWDGLQTLRHLRERHPELPVVMVTDHADAETAVKAMKLGAVYYTSKKPQMAALHTVIERELQQVALKRFYLEENGKRYGRLIGDSVEMKHIYEQIGRLARTGFSVLINGESGTGKELVPPLQTDGDGKLCHAGGAVGCCSAVRAHPQCIHRCL